MPTTHEDITEDNRNPSPPFGVSARKGGHGGGGARVNDVGTGAATIRGRIMGAIYIIREKIMTTIGGLKLATKIGGN